MNQSNMQNNQVRQISPEEIQRVSQGSQLQATQMTPEELQKTQVLNLQDVEKVVHFEKVTSKKPAIILAILGILLVTCGATFQIIENLKSNNKSENSTVQKRQVTDKDKNKLVNKKDRLTCTKTTQNNADGTDTTYNVVYNFKDEQLINFEKHFKVVPSPGNAAGLEGVKGYTIGYQPYMINSINGYNIIIATLPDNSQITCDVLVDLETIDLAQYPAGQQNHFSTSIDYALYTKYDVIRNDLELKNFKCE